MQARYFALVMGILFLVAGIAGFIPGLTVPSMHHEMEVPAVTGEAAPATDAAPATGTAPTTGTAPATEAAPATPAAPAAEAGPGGGMQDGGMQEGGMIVGAWPLDAAVGLLLGLFPVNILHNLFHIAFGIWGVAAWRGVRGARTFAGTTALVYAVLVVFGFIPGLMTLFGLVPLYGYDIWLHLVIAVAAAIFAIWPGRVAMAPART